MAFYKNRGSGFTYRKTPVLFSQRTTFPPCSAVLTPRSRDQDIFIVTEHDNEIFVLYIYRNDKCIISNVDMMRHSIFFHQKKNPLFGSLCLLESSKYLMLRMLQYLKLQRQHRAVLSHPPVADRTPFPQVCLPLLRNED